MFRPVAYVVSCLVPLLIAPCAGAQPFTADGPTAAPLGPPMSLTQPYMPQAASPLGDMSLLVGNAAPPPAPAPYISAPHIAAPHIAVTGFGSARTAADHLRSGRKMIVISDAPARAR